MIVNMNAAVPADKPVFLAPRAITKEKAKQLRVVSHAHAMLAAALVDCEKEFQWPPLIGQALKELTVKQRKYAIRVACGTGQHDAYRTAYDVSVERADRTLYADIHELNNHPRISNAIDLLQSWLDQKWLLDAIEVRDYVSSLMYEQSICGDNSAARIKAGEVLLRMHGLLVDKREVIHRDINEISEQTELFKSILSDISLLASVEPEQPQALPEPTT